jgi:hypothetical protein
MEIEDLREQIETELDLIRETLNRVDRLRLKIGKEEPDDDQLAAAGAYLANLYTGVENILKRIVKFRHLSLPEGPNWHVSLLRMFGPSAGENLPLLIDEDLLNSMGPYLGFRHLLMHGYAIMLRWDRLGPNLERANSVFPQFADAVSRFVETECQRHDRRGKTK